MILCIKSARYLSNFSPAHNVLKDVVCRRKVRFETTYHWSSWAYNTSHADKHVAKAWISFRYLSSYNRCPQWSVRTCIKIFLSYSVHCWEHKFYKGFSVLKYKHVYLFTSSPDSQYFSGSAHSCLTQQVHSPSLLYVRLPQCTESLLNTELHTWHTTIIHN